MGELIVSCPHCSHLIECHATFAGRQIQCPSCGQTLTVPARPMAQPSSPAKEPISRLALCSLILSCGSILVGPLGFLPGIICGYLAKEQIRRQPELKGRGYAKMGLAVGFTFLWLSVAIVIGCLIVHVVNVNRSPQAANPPAASNVVPSAGPSAANGNTSGASQGAVPSELQKVEQAVQNQVKLVRTTTARFNSATRNRDTLHATYKGKNLPQATYNAVMQQYKAADDEVANSQAAMNAARNNFEAAFARYQQLGGKTDYRSQLP